MKKITVKIALDFILILLLSVMYNKMAIGLKFHEISGLVLFGLFLLHKSFNLKWITSISKKIFKKNIPNKTRLGYFINVLLFICFVFIILSGILMSKTILTFISSENIFWKLGHFFVSALAIILCGIHLGLHWSVLKGTLFKYLKSSKILNYLSIIALIAIVIYGGYSIVNSNFSSWITIPIKVLSQNQNNQEKHKGNRPPQKDTSIPTSQIIKEDSIKIFKAVTTYGSIAITFATVTALIESTIKVNPNKKSL